MLNSLPLFFHSGFTLVGVSGIGEQSCLQTSITALHRNDVAAASQVTYYGAAEGKKSVAITQSCPLCCFLCIFECSSYLLLNTIA